MRIECKSEGFLKNLPEGPGVYKYFNAENKLLYVGKAKNLRKRVSSYFQKQHHDHKTRVMVKQIRFVEILLVESELDALLLENNLIKENKPRYNILLKDDKTYPWICLTKEPFPRIFSTRNRHKSNAEYFGPFPKGNVHKNLLELVHELYPIRSCSLELTEQKINSERYSVCLEYHLKRCQGPCINYELLDFYQQNIDEIRLLLKGKTNALIQRLRKNMEKEAQALAFEKAHEIKSRIATLNAFHSKSAMVNDLTLQCDVLACKLIDDHLYYNYTWVREGRIDLSISDKMLVPHMESIEELTLILWHELKIRFSSNQRTILTNIPIHSTIEGYRFTTPQRGDKLKILDFSLKNISHATAPKKPGAIHYSTRLEALKELVKLPEIPLHIECFDNSNIQGEYAVAACVVFKNGKPSSKDYRHFNIRTVEGPDDFASMREIVTRRYQRLIKEGQSLPDLIVIDGGKGQLSSAVEALQTLGIFNKVAVIGLAKKLEEIFFPGASEPLMETHENPGLQMLQHLRNEAHRFGITHHRNRRSSAFIDSAWKNIPGVGEKSLEKILKHYPTPKSFEEDDPTQREVNLGKRLAETLGKYFITP
jgi:excinuclease ABC subunit C